MKEYSLAQSSWGKEELQAIQNVIESNRFSMGPYVEKFEKEFAAYFGSKFGVMVNSGSSANLLAIAAMFYIKENKLKRGDEVIVPAVSWSTTYTPLYQYGLKVKFVDIDRKTLNYDLEALESAITDKTKLIVIVNLLGNPSDFLAIQNLASKRDIRLFEDNCESMGAKFKNKFCGTFGLMGTFSTFFSHHMSTMEGGMILTDDQELYHILLSTRSHGWTRTLPKENLVTGTKSDIEFDESFKFVLPGYNLRPLEMSGAIGTEQLKKLDQFVAARKKNAIYFMELFKETPYLSFQKEIGDHSWFGFSFIIDEKAPFTRQEMIAHLTSNKIECRPIVTGNFANNEVLKYFDYEIHGELKNANHIDSNGFFVGNHHLELKEEIDWLKEKVTEFISRFS